jgi:branched-chain amino acid transport system ATP-binding protein
VTTVDDKGAASQSSVPVLEFRQMRAAYGRIEVLHGVDLSIPAGSVFVLLGPNGAGKSTILKVAGGRMRHSAGTVLIDGVPLEKAAADTLARKGICTVPEGRGVFPNLTVRENLLMWTYRGGVKPEEAESRAFERFPKLATRRKQLAGTLSGGEQQMLAVARALVARPRLLLLDEISMGLAPLVVVELFEVVRQLAGEGITIVLAEQFVHTALELATEGAIIVHGRVERVGSPDQLGAAAAGAYLAEAGR